MSLLVVALLAVGGLVYFAKLQFDKKGPLDHTTVFVIPRGEGVNVIAERLEHEGIISDRRIFVASVIYFKVQERLKAGEYELRKYSSMREVLDKLVEGRAVLHKVSIPEGLTSEQILARLNAHTMLKGEIPEIPPEGSLLPDTYKFSRGMTRQDLIGRMQAEQHKFVERLWEKRQANLPFKTPQDAIILASIVEKETSRADERSRIAGVFINRLRKGIRLQSDPTIIYGIAGGKGSLGRGILQSELEKDTPYNTYKIKGLTPTPIANPGRAAIEAVLNPADTKDLYFVADGTGGHVFAPSLAKHNQNVAAWRKIERERREKEEAEARAKAAAEVAAAATPAQPGAYPAPDNRFLDQPAISGLSLETAPGGVSGSLIEGLTISLPPPDGGVSAPMPVAEAPTAAASEPVIQASNAGGADTAPPLPKRKPAR
ncbi:MAG: endolytic transglycosylase MltG, partial [Methyloligellaceae bacterium]